MDSEFAGLLGALVGGGATFAGAVISNTQQARRERRDRREQRKVRGHAQAFGV
jgi:hypothetical protein